MNSQNITEHYNRAESYLQQREYDKAITELSKVIEVDPKNIEAYVKRGYAYNKKGDYDKALEDFNLAIEMDSKQANAYVNRGVSYYQKGDYGKAIADSEKYLELEPDGEVAGESRKLLKLSLDMKKRDKMFTAAGLLLFIAIFVNVFFLLPNLEFYPSLLYLAGLSFAIRGLLFFAVLRIFYKLFSLQEFLLLVSGVCMILVAFLI